MKKIIALCMVFFMAQTFVQAKDYAKQHLKEMRRSQKYSATANYFEEAEENVDKNSNIEIKDPKLIMPGDYKIISKSDYNAKLAKDKVKYAETLKFLLSRKVDDYNVQAYGEDFYKVYRIAERIIRANNLDFVNWRIAVVADSNFNAYSSETNCIAVHTGAIDTLTDNEDAMALVIGHEIAHSMLGHKARMQELFVKLKRAERIGGYDAYVISLRKMAYESKKMEFAADTEGAKFIARAGYDLDKAKETLAYLNTLGNAKDNFAMHPKTEDRIKSLAENRKYFMEKEWADQGRYNIYNSDVLKCQKSSKRNSLTILRGEMKTADYYYSLETPEKMYMRYGYKSYLNGEYKDAIKYFEKALKENKGNYVAYLYLSYVNECLYKLKDNDKYLEQAVKYAQFAQKLEPDNKYVKEQVQAL